ncbi:hypothetical protein CYMTET_55911, partial [Cymbomonas tetramitiformis]
ELGMRKSDIGGYDRSKSDIGEDTQGTLSASTEKVVGDEGSTSFWLSKEAVHSSVGEVAKLQHVNLEKAFLQHANFEKAYLRKATLTEAVLRKANLTEADLSEANLTSAKLQHVNLEKAKLSDANLEKAVLSEANLTSAVLSEANLTSAVLRKAKLDKAYLRHANLEKANLMSATLTSAVLLQANLTSDKAPETTTAESADSGKTDSPNPDLTTPSLESGWLASIVQQQQQQQIAAQNKLMEMLVEQVQHLSTKSEKEESVGTSVVTKGDKEVARRRKLPYVPFDKNNPYPPRPLTLDNRMPQLTIHLLRQRVYETHNTVEGAFTLLANRYSIIQLRASLDGDASAHGGTEALRANLVFLEEKVYSSFEGFVADSIFNQWMAEFEATRQRAVMNNTMHSNPVAVFLIVTEDPTLEVLVDPACSTSPRTVQAVVKAKAMGLAVGPSPMPDVPGTALPGSSLFRDRPEAADSPGEGTAKEGSVARGGRQRGGHAMGVSWSENQLAARTSSAVRSRRFTTRSDGVAADVVEEGGATTLGQRCLGESEKTRVRFADCSGAEDWLKPVEDRVRLPMVELLLPQVAVQDGIPEEAETSGGENSWCFSFDLQDGYRCVGIDQDFQKYMQFDVLGELFPCSALLFGWNDSPRVFVKFMKVLVECLRSPTAHRDRADLRRLKSGTVLNRLGLRRNEKKGQWTPAQVVEHMGLEVNFLKGEFRVTEARLQKIYSKATDLLCEAAREKRWARYIRSDENEWADRLSRDTDVDDWKLNRRWFDWAQDQWGEHTVVRFALEISAQLLRYYAQWWDPLCEGVDSLSYDWRGETNWIKPPWGLLDKVAHKLREEGAGGTVVVPYLPGQSWFRELELGRSHVSHCGAPVSVHARECRALEAPVPEPGVGEQLEVFWPLDDAWYRGTVAEISAEGRHHIKYDDGEEAWLLLSEEMQEEALGAATRGNYDPKAKRFRDFYVQEGREWLPATEETVRLYIAAVLEKGGIQATSMQPYLSAINNHHEEMGYPGPAKGRGVVRAIKGMARLQVAAAQEAGETVLERTWLPAKHVRTVHEAALTLVPDNEEQLRLLRAYTFVVLAFLSFGRPDTGSSLQQENVITDDDGVTVILTREKGRNRVLKKRQLAIPWRGGHFSAHSNRKGATTWLWAWRWRRSDVEAVCWTLIHGKSRLHNRLVSYWPPVGLGVISGPGIYSGGRPEWQVASLPTARSAPGLQCRAILEEARLIKTQLDGAILDGANMNRTKLEGLDFENVQFSSKTLLDDVAFPSFVVPSKRRLPPADNSLLSALFKQTALHLFEGQGGVDDDGIDDDDDDDDDDDVVDDGEDVGAAEPSTPDADKTIVSVKTIEAYCAELLPKFVSDMSSMMRDVLKTMLTDVLSDEGLGYTIFFEGNADHIQESVVESVVEWVFRKLEKGQIASVLDSPEDLPALLSSLQKEIGDRRELDPTEGKKPVIQLIEELLSDEDDKAREDIRNGVKKWIREQ